MSIPWFPVEVDLGELPAFDQEQKVYKLEVPADATEVLIYTFITSIGEGNFQRAYYQIITSDGNKEFKQYMNVAIGQGVNIVNSANLWVPMPANKVLTVKLIYPKSSTANKHIAGKLAESQDWSRVFIIRYRT